jgi:ribonuclease E
LVEEEAPAPAPVSDDTPAAEKPKKPRRAARPKKATAEETPAPTVDASAETSAETPVIENAAADPVAAKPAKPRATRRKPAAAAEAAATPVVSSTIADAPAEVAEKTEEKVEDKPKRAGWWQRKGFF